MNKAYQFRIYPNEEQKIMFAKTFGCVRFIYNNGCELELDLCCKCMDELIDSCTISPIADDRYYSEGGD